MILDSWVGTPWVTHADAAAAVENRGVGEPLLSTPVVVYQEDKEPYNIN